MKTGVLVTDKTGHVEVDDEGIAHSEMQTFPIFIQKEIYDYLHCMIYIFYTMKVYYYRTAVKEEKHIHA